MNMRCVESGHWCAVCTSLVQLNIIIRQAKTTDYTGAVSDPKGKFKIILLPIAGSVMHAWKMGVKLHNTSTWSERMFVLICTNTVCMLRSASGSFSKDDDKNILVQVNRGDF